MHIYNIVRLGLGVVATQIAASHLITSPASLPRVEPTAYPGVGVGDDGLFGRLPGLQLFKRSRVQCDPKEFWCPTGTCFTDINSLIGCCSVVSCAPRTTCIPYHARITSPCDINTGGCIYCSDTANPACLTITNAANGQWIHYCAPSSSTQTVSYVNPITTGSHADGFVATIPTSANRNMPFTPQPAMCQRPPCSVQEPGLNGGTVTSSTVVSSATHTTVPAPLSTYSPARTTPAIPSESSSAPAFIEHTAAPTLEQSTDGSAALPTSEDHAHHESLSNGMVAGIVCAAAATGGLTFAALWYTRQQWLAMFQTKQSGSPTTSSRFDDEDSPDTFSTGSESKYWSQAAIDAAKANGRHRSVSSPKPVADIEVRGLGIDGASPKRYAPTNPDPEPMSATDNGSPTRFQFEERTAAAAAMAKEDMSLPSSPSMSCLAPPKTPVSPQTDITPSSNDGYTHTSPVTPSPIHKFTAFTPSVYVGNEPPSSIPQVPHWKDDQSPTRTVSTTPPSLPQEYSTITLGSTANIYRGLSQRGESSWAYLSPEDAMNGGWRNDEEGRP